MRRICDDLDTFKTPRKYLISALSGKKQLISTSLIEWYLKKDFEITNIEYLIRFEGREIFKTFAEKVTLLRQIADEGGSTIRAEIAKAIG